jgi:hypothetical protein
MLIDCNEIRQEFRPSFDKANVLEQSHKNNAEITSCHVY